LKTLPTWFGIPASVEDYIATADRSPTIIASRGGQDVGLLTLLRHSRYAAEVYVMCCRSFIAKASAGRCSGMPKAYWPRTVWSFSKWRRSLRASPTTGTTRRERFYLAYGFRPLEEFRNLWDAENPALQMIKVIPKVGVVQ
jgi:hypothetical protein